MTYREALVTAIETLRTSDDEMRLRAASVLQRKHSRLRARSEVRLVTLEWCDCGERKRAEDNFCHGCYRAFPTAQKMKTGEVQVVRPVEKAPKLESNIRIATAARALVPPFEWEVNSPGFVPMGGTWEKCPRERRTIRSEREVFEFVHLEFKPPEERR